MLFWKKTESKLQLGESQGKIWNHQVVKSSFVSARSQDIVAYTGWTYILEGEQQGAVFSGRATCNTLQPALLELDVAVSEPVHVNVSCNGERLWSGLLELVDDSSIPTLHHLSIDITQQKETKAVSDIDVEIVFADQPGTIWVLLDEDTQRAPKIRQIPSWSYASWTILFFVAAWGVLFGGLVVGISVSRFNDNPYLTTPIAVLAPLLGYFGLRNIAKMPLGVPLRRLYAWTRSRSSPVAISVLVLLSVSCSLAAMICIDGSWRRHAYNNLINNNSTEDIRAAFIREPWRREAQILFEQATYKKRANREDFREFVQIFTDNKEVTDAIALVGSKAPFYLREDTDGVSDPVIWFASILPEGDDNHDPKHTDQAINLLGTRSTCEAHILKLVLSIPLAQTEEEHEALRKELEKQIDRCKSEDSSIYSLQLAFDMLGNIYVKTDFVEAIDNFLKLLRYRNLNLHSPITKDNGRTFWRLPDKLVLFALFKNYILAHRAGDDPVYTTAKPILDHKIGGVNFGSVFKTKVFDMDPKFQIEDAWYEGTIHNFDVTELSTIGWRF